MRTNSHHAIDKRVERLTTLTTRRNQSCTITSTGTHSTGIQIQVASAMPTQLFDTKSQAEVWLRANIRPT